MPASHATFRIFLAVPLFATIVLSGCGGDSSNDDGPFTKLWKSDFSSCGTNCHRADADDGTEDGPDMSSQSAFYANLVNKNITNDYPNWIRGGDCDDTPFINPNNAAKSTLMTGLVQSYADDIVASGDCGTSSYNIHETNSVTLSDSAAVIDWINQGAANN